LVVLDAELYEGELLVDVKAGLDVTPTAVLVVTGDDVELVNADPSDTTVTFPGIVLRKPPALVMKSSPLPES
jgi:hypothetical protein